MTQKQDTKSMTQKHGTKTMTQKARHKKHDTKSIVQQALPSIIDLYRFADPKM